MPRDEEPMGRPADADTPPVSARGKERFVARYLRLIEHVTRGWAAIVLSVVFFAAASLVSEAVSGRGGLALASVWVLFMGSYCALNFLHCRETHCLITGTGWPVLSLAGFAAALTPGPGISWFGVNVEAGAFVVILGLGYALECAVAARTGRRALR